MSAIYYTHQKPTIDPRTRCDRCSQHAKVHVTLPMFDGIYFCSHHFNVNQAALEQDALAIVDERRAGEFKTIPESVIAQ